MIGLILTALSGIVAFFWFSSSWWAAFAFGFSLSFFLIFIFYAQLIVRYYFYPATENVEIGGTSGLSILVEDSKEEKVVKALESQFAEKYKELKKIHQADIDQREASISEVIFLRDRVRKEQEDINDCVTLEKFLLDYTKDEPIPLIIFTFLIKNNSVFDVTLENKIDGYIEFLGMVLSDEKSFQFSPEVIPSASHKWFYIAHSVSPVKLDAVKNKKIKEGDFNIRNLVLTIKGTDKFPNVKTRQVRMDGLIKPES